MAGAQTPPYWTYSAWHSALHMRLLHFAMRSVLLHGVDSCLEWRHYAVAYYSLILAVFCRDIWKDRLCLLAALAQVRAWSRLVSASPVLTPATTATTSMNSTPKGPPLFIMLSGYVSCPQTTACTFITCKFSTPHTQWLLFFLSFSQELLLWLWEQQVWLI